MSKISDKLNIDKHEGVESALNEVKLLLTMFEDKGQPDGQ